MFEEKEKEREAFEVSKTEIFLILFELVDVHFDRTDCFAEAFDLAVECLLLSLKLIGLHQLLLSNEIVESLLSLVFLGLDDVDLSVFLVQLDFNSRVLSLVSHLPGIFFVKAGLTVAISLELMIASVCHIR